MLRFPMGDRSRLAPATRHWSHRNIQKGLRAMKRLLTSVFAFGLLLAAAQVADAQVYQVYYPSAPSRDLFDILRPGSSRRRSGRHDGLLSDCGAGHALPAADRRHGHALALCESAGRLSDHRVLSSVVDRITVSFVEKHTGAGQ